jgi:autotransporter translocation and assembly factor TamB
LKIGASISGMDAGYDTYEAQQLALRAGIEFAVTDPTMTITVDELSFLSPSGGKFSTKLKMAGDDITARVDFDHFGTDGYLPQGLKKLAAGKMNGHFGIAANIGDKRAVRLSDLDLRYDRAFRVNAIPASVRLTGQAQASAEAASTSGLHIAIPGATVDLRGKVELAKKLVDVGLRVGVSDLPTVLSTMNVGPLAKSAALAVNVTGSMDRPNADGRLEVKGIGGGKTGIPAVDDLATGFRLQDGTLTVESLRAGIAGGVVEGGGSAKLFEKSVGKMLAAPILDFHLDGKRLSLQELIVSGVVSGQVSFALTASGTAKKPKVHFQVPAGTTVEVLGQAWLLEGIDIEADKDMLVVKLCHVAAKAGGDIRVEGHVDLTHKPLSIDWTVKILDLPLAAILATAKVEAPVSGRLSINLHVTGTVEKPAIEGNITLADVRAFDIPFGNATLALTPSADGGVAVVGNLFKLLDVEATGGYGPKGPRAKALLSFQNLHAEDLLPELKEQGVATAISGQVSFEMMPGQLPKVDVRITQIEAAITRDIEHEDGSLGAEKIWLKNASDLHIVTDTEKVVVEPARLITRGGEFTMSGQLHPLKDGKGEVVDQAVQADFAGKLDLELLQPLVASKFTSIGGGIGLEVHAGGSVRKPDLSGKIAILRPVRAEARGFEQSLLIPSGAVRLTSSAVELSDLAVTIGDATMKVAGKVNLGPGFAPESVALSAHGEVSASLLESIAPKAVSDVSGKASISAQVSGKLDDPQITARISLGEIQMRLRGISSHVAVQSGIVELSSHEILLTDVKVRLDDEGELLIGAKGVRPGRVHFRSLRPELVWDGIDFPLAGNRLSYRDQGIEVDDLSLRTELKGNPTDGLAFSGDVRLISGRYLQDFNVRNLVLSSRINESSSSKPFWTDQPLLAKLALDLRVRTEGDGFVVRNNLTPAEIHVLIDLGVGGTLSVPTLSGEIRPTDGSFHIIGLRGDFELSPNVNHVTFVPTKSIAAGDTPELNLEAQNTTALDSAGNEHVVIMKITGPINQATIDLSTTDGMDRNQTMLLLLSGRTTDNLSGNTGQIFGMNQQSGLDMLGQVSRDTVSNLVEPYINDTLQMLTGRKWKLLPTVGADGVEIKIQARTTREFDLEMSYLRGFQSQERYKIRGVAWFRDYFTGSATGERLTYSLQQGLPMLTNNFKLELTFEYPLRFPNP